jgi:hypothetical protein
MSKITYVTDKKHLICVPYSIENLHKMAEKFGIGKSLFKINHYSLSKFNESAIERISKKCRIISTSNIIEVIRSPQYADIIISDVVAAGANGNSHSFEATQIQIEGQNLNYDNK